MPYAKNQIDLTGQKFGYLTAIRRDGRSGRNAAWRCECACGAIVTAASDRLREGKRKSCALNGHFWRPTYPESLAAKYKSEHVSWRSMRERCFNEKHQKYPTYGGRGITMCARWVSFETFVRDMGAKPAPSYTIERLDVNGNYEPGNCKWATRAEQSRNQRRSVYVDYEGVPMLLIDVVAKLVVAKLGLDRIRVYNRLKLGWSLEEALSIPVKQYRKQK